MKLEIKAELEDGKKGEFKYDIQPDEVLEFIPKILEDFSNFIGATPQEFVQYMGVGLGLAAESIS